jgi:1-deoxy-D-xylulose-5-phosphate synthase
MLKLAEGDNRIVAITAAMSDGTGLNDYAKRFPKRFFDVGIAEGHALTFAAGLAADGMRPVCAIYSTFLQRAIDQIIHDIALQNLPVVMAIDRAGLVGEDGGTHNGAFDLSYLRYIPNIAIMAPSDENELQHMLFSAINLNMPVAIRYPRGFSGSKAPLDNEFKNIPLGKAEIKQAGKNLNILAIGSCVIPALEAASILNGHGVSAGVVNMRFAKPLDSDLVRRLAHETGKIAVVEENSCIGGLYGAVCELLAGSNTAVLPIALPDQFIEHGAQSLIRDKYGFSAQKIAAAIMEWK